MYYILALIRCRRHVEHMGVQDLEESCCVSHRRWYTEQRLLPFLTNMTSLDISIDVPLDFRPPKALYDQRLCSIASTMSQTIVRSTHHIHPVLFSQHEFMPSARTLFVKPSLIV